MLVVCDTIEKDFLDFSPSLVVEILSPSTALKDRYSKFDIYEKQQIKYYLIVSPDKEEVEIYSIENRTYQLKQTGKNVIYTFSFEVDCNVTIDFKEIW
ncbi:MAG: Uma2 family endonuclease [Segetibacter sp.]